LGEYNNADLYYCDQEISCGKNMPTVIARYSSDLPDYVSGLIGADYHPELSEAKKRAKARGLLR
jgi:hypothetical protein